MEYVALTNFARINRILKDIDGRKVNFKNVPNSLCKDGRPYFGKIGDDVTFTCSLRKVDRSVGYNFKYATEQVRLMSRGEKLGIICVCNEWVRLPQKRDKIPTTKIKVYSPNYENDGVITKTIEANNQLLVFHAPDETADSVIDNICDAVAYSRARMDHVKKYSQLNIATRLSGVNWEK